MDLLLVVVSRIQYQLLYRDILKHESLSLPLYENCLPLSLE